MKTINRYDNLGGKVTEQGHDSLIQFIQLALHLSGRKDSKSEANRLIRDNAVRLNGTVVKGGELVNLGDILQIGKKIWYKFDARVDLIETLAIALDDVKL